MDDDLKKLKETLREVASTSPTRSDAKSLLRYYKMLIGSDLPVRKYGYSDPVKFLLDKCSDCFLFQGFQSSPTNPTLTVVVPPQQEHLDPDLEHKGRRQSVRERQLLEDKAQYIHNIWEAKKILKEEISEIIAEHPEGVWCDHLLRLYREKYSRELDFTRHGYVTLVTLAMEAEDVLALHYPRQGDYLLINSAHYAASPPLAPLPRPNRPALFPEDCMGLEERIPAASLTCVSSGYCLSVFIAEVYSPSHFWMLRLGADHYSALDDITNEMSEYYESGEGRDRRLKPSNIRVGYYCTARYEGKWHRTLIVKVVDSTTVKVRYVDYGTVECYDVSALRLLLRRWGYLPAQALRARLTAVRPYGPGCRWPIRATMRFHELVSGRQLLAEVYAVDQQDKVLEVNLRNMATEEDVCIGDEMLREGHARPAVVGSAIRMSECYLFPHFAPLESGDRFNYAEVCVFGATASGSTTSPARLPEESRTLPSDPADSPPLSSPAASHCEPKI